MQTFQQYFVEGLWANINAKKKRGGKSASKGSKAYKAAKKAGDKLEATKENVTSENFMDGKKKGRVVRVESKEQVPVATDQLPVCANEPKIVVVRKARCTIGART